MWRYAWRALVGFAVFCGPALADEPDAPPNDAAALDPGLRGLIEGLNDADAQVRQRTATRLAKPPTDSLAVVVPALGQALNDPSGSVRIAALRSLATIGAAAIDMVQPVLESQKKYGASGTQFDTAYIKFYAAVATQSPDAMDALIRYAKTGGARPGQSTGSTVNRRAAMRALGDIGPPAAEAIPLLLSSAKVFARDLYYYSDEFEVAVEALSKIAVGNSRVRKTLEGYQRGKGLGTRGHGYLLERGIVVADTAVKRLDQTDSEEP